MSHAKIVNFLLSVTVILATLLFGCAPVLKKEAKRPQDALREVGYLYPDFIDDMDIASLKTAIKRNLEYLRKLNPDHIFYYGNRVVPPGEVIKTQERFLSIISLKGLDSKDLKKVIRDEFILLKATGRQGNPKVLFTGYFEPIFEANRWPNHIYQYPIYRLPADMVTVDLSLFREKCAGRRLVGRLQGQSLIPYYTRSQIVKDRVLDGRGLEIAWLKDPVDVLFLQIQGSGKLVLPDGSMIHVGYMGSNGHPYRSIGRYMVEKGYLKLEEVSMQGIRRYLRKHPHFVDEILGHNPSYVFFREMDSGPVGNIGVVLTPGRSIALDSRLFPKGALCFISCEKPVIDGAGNITNWTRFSRFVLNQDTGGAIKGAGRADIFWGSGKYAEIAAGHQRHEGELYILIAK